MIDYLLDPYKNYETSAIILEFTAFLFGVFSVYFAKQNHILVYPIGIISTSIYVYLLYNWQLLGDMIVNIYYTAISIVGWYYWAQKKDNKKVYQISKSTKQHSILYLVFFVFTVLFVYGVYSFFKMFKTWHNYVDTITTGLFFVAMLAMAKKRLEHWLFWIIGNILSIPLYFLKGYMITSLQYFVFLILAVLGYKEWKKIYNKSQVKLQK